MRINYKGIDGDFQYRIAEICFSESEIKVIERLAFWLERIKGWKVDIVSDGYAICQVDSMTEYEQFKKDYMAGKRMIKNCIKYGF